MEVIEPGHIYDCKQLDGDGTPLRLVFVRRDKEPFHEGTQIQEVIRTQIDMLDALIDRTNHCDDCLRWEGNDVIIKHFSECQRRLRLALLKFEERALERKVDKHGFKPEDVVTGPDGHFKASATEFSTPPDPIGKPFFSAGQQPAPSRADNERFEDAEYRANFEDAPTDDGRAKPKTFAVETEVSTASGRDPRDLQTGYMIGVNELGDRAERHAERKKAHGH